MRIIVLLVLALAGTLHAQVTTATFYGVVHDSSGAVVPRAMATLTNERTGAVRTLAADPQGEFGFQFVPVGVYTLRIEATGFRTWETAHIELGAGHQVRKVYALQVGDVTQTIEVSDSGTLLQTVSAEQRQDISTREISALPVVNRTLMNLMTLNPAAIDMGSGKLSLGGLGMNSTSFTQDGIDASSNPQSPSTMFQSGTNYISIVSMEAVQELQVTKGVAPAEYSRMLGGNINVITKSGSNTWRGSAFELFNSEELNARLQFLKTKPGRTFNQFGGSLGGPIRKNKAFIFGAFEGYEERTPVVLNGSVPTPSLRNSAIAAVPAYKTYLDLFPQPNQPYAASATTATYIGAGALSSSDKNLVVRSDIRLSDRALFSATYVHAMPQNIIPSILAANTRLFSCTGNRLNLNFTYIGGPIWSSETRFGYNRNDRSYSDGIFHMVDKSQPETMPGGRRLPIIAFPGLGTSGEYNLIGRAPHSNIDEKVSVKLGRHSLKFGTLLFWNEFGSENIQNPSVSYTNLADLLSNTPNSIAMTYGRNDADGKGKEWGLFVQDDFRVRPGLTLNLGVRYDYFGHLTVNGPGTSGPPHIYNIADLTLPTFQYTKLRPVDNPYESDRFNIGPRMGFAYNPKGSGKTVIRGGFGAMFLPLNGEIPKNMVLNAADEPFRSTYSRQDALRLGLKYPVFNQDALQLIKGKVAAPSLPYLDPRIAATYSLMYSLTVERAFTRTFALETTFIGTRGVKVTSKRWYNTADRVTGLAPNPGLASGGTYFDNSDSSQYFGWLTTVRKQYSRGLLAKLHYTWGKVIAYNGGNMGFGYSYVQDFFNIRANKGPAECDIRHNLGADFVYEVPTLGASSRNPVLSRILGGWVITGVFTARTGTPLRFTQSNTLGDQRPDLVDPTHVFLKKGLQYLNPAAFARVPINSVSGATIRPGTLGNGAIHAPSLWNLDTALLKNFKVAEKYQMQFRADLLNGLNHTNFSNVGTSIDVPSTFGTYAGTAGARKIQLALRFHF